MKTPTYSELLEFVDGTLEPARYREIEHLVLQSKRLQKEIEMITMTNMVVKSQRIAPSGNFTATVMNEITPQAGESVWYRMVKNSSNVFAMTVVLAMIGFVLVSTSGSMPATRSPISQSVETFSTAYQSAAQYVSQWLRQTAQPLGEATKSSTGKMLLIGCVILFFYVTIDGVVVKRFILRK